VRGIENLSFSTFVVLCILKNKENKGTIFNSSSPLLPQERA